MGILNHRKFFKSSKLTLIATRTKKDTYIVIEESTAKVWGTITMLKSSFAHSEDLIFERGNGFPAKMDGVQLGELYSLQSNITYAFREPE